MGKCNKKWERNMLYDLTMKKNEVILKVLKRLRKGG